ncbi:ATP-binding protein [Chloroflexota bacterium]
MEQIGEILRRRKTQTNISRANMDTWSGAEEPEPEPNSLCPICQGAGYVHPRLPSGKPDFSRVIPCRCTQEELKEEQHARLMGYSHLGALSHLTFDNLEPQGRSGIPSQQERFHQAYQAALSFADEPQGWLILSGSSGSGKTHLAAAIANRRINKGYSVFFISTADLLDHLRATYNPNSELAYDELIERVRNVPLLILDDLGIQSSTPWAKEKMDQILNHRFTAELPTVIITITPIEQLEDRLRTRLTDPRLCHICVLEDKTPSSLDYTGSLGLELLRTMTFDTFDWRRVNLPLEQRQNLEMVFHGALNFAKAPDAWLVLQGTTGCGKTHIAAAIANYQLQASKPVSFVVVPDFLDHLRSTFSPESKVSYDQIFESVKQTTLLVLDDFGEQSTTPWAQEKLYQVINYRYNARLATVITTRLSLDEIDSPVGSRFADHKISTVFNITAPDYRSDVQFNQKNRTYRRNKRESHT